jgi:hypothetical protein
MVNIQAFVDDAKCFGTIREMRWPAHVAAGRSGPRPRLAAGSSSALAAYTLPFYSDGSAA